MRALTLAAIAVLLFSVTGLGAAPAPFIVPLPDERFSTVPNPNVTPKPTLPPIIDTIPETPQPIRPRVVVPTPRLAVVEPSVTPSTRRSVSGKASWFCRAGRSPCTRSYPDTAGFDAYAAAGPGLRAAICGTQSCASWRGRIVVVNGIRVTLSDWCQCYWRQSNEKLVDLYYDVFQKTGGNVVISW